jgi:hypothetical protein
MQQYIIEKLKRVSFDRVLFLKEFQKSRRWLKKEELDEVEQWAKVYHKLDNESEPEESDKLKSIRTGK